MTQEQVERAASESPDSEPAAAPSSQAERPASVSKPLDMSFAIATLIIAASLIMVLWNLQDSSLTNANTGSRFATIESLVDYGTYYIDNSQYRGTIDKVKVGEHFLSSKPPTLPTYAAGAYWLLQKVTGYTIASHEGPVVWFISLCTGWLAHLVFLVYFYRFCRLLLQRQLALIGALAAAAFSYLGVAYATAINNHSIGAAMALVGFYYAFRIRNEHNAKLRHWIVSGLCFGFLSAVDLPCTAFVPLVVLYLGTYNWRRTLSVFVPMLLPGLLCQLVLSYSTTGSLKPAYLNSEVKQFEGNYFKGNQRGIDALREPKHIYAFNVLLGHHGLFSMTPLLCFGAYELVRSFRKRLYFAETLLVSAVSLIILTFFIFRSRNYGGWCVGMRWLIPIMPLLLLYFGIWLDRVRLSRWLWGGVLAAFSVGAFHVQDGLTSPFQFSVWHNLLEGAPNRNRVGKKFNTSRKPASGKKKPAGSKPPRPVRSQQ